MRSSWREIRLATCAAPAALLVGILLIYWQVIGHDFLDYDDQSYIFENPFVSSGLSLRNVAWAFTTFHSCNWHPVTWLSHMLDVHLFGLAPAGHHLMNVLLHGANTFLLLRLLGSLTARWRESFVVAALFALHPLHVESVAWAAERKDLLSTLFCILALHVYVKHVKGAKGRTFLLATALFALSLMSKPMFVTLPLVMLLLDYWPLNRFRPTRQEAADPAGAPLQKLLLEKLPFCALALASAAITVAAQKKGEAIATLGNSPLADRVANALVAAATYLGKMLWPRDLAALYPFAGAPPLWQSLGAAVLLLLITAMALRQRLARPYLLVGWLWYLTTLIPVIGIVQVGVQAYADRYTYLPLTGIFIMLVWGAADISRRWPRRQIVLGGVTVLVLVACTTLSREQVTYWRTTRALFSHALESAADNAVTRATLGVAYAKEGDLREAVKHLAVAVKLDPARKTTRYNLGLAFHKLGRLDEAIEWYRGELRVNPGHEDCRFNLDLALGERETLRRQAEGAGSMSR